MWPLPNPFDLFGDAASAVSGWAWDKVIQGIYTWVANGLLLLMEWVWGVLDEASSPRLTEPWFAGGLLRPLAGLSVGIVAALMVASAIQAAWAGRPELIVDACKEGPKAIVATALTVTVLDVLVRGADVLAEVLWQTGRGDVQRVLDGVARTVTAGGPMASTFVAPLVLLFGMVGLAVTAVVLLVRSSLLYLVAGFAPVVWAAGVSPVLRGSHRRLVSVAVSLVLAKPAIVLTLVVAGKVTANAVPTPGPGAGASGGAAAVGTLVTGFACFAIAGLSPWVVYRLLPNVEQASVGTGIVSGWGRTATTAAQSAMLAKSLGASGSVSAASRGLPVLRASSGGSPAGGTTSGSGSGQAHAGSGTLPLLRPSTATGAAGRPAAATAAAAPVAAGETPGSGRPVDDSSSVAGREADAGVGS